MKLLNIMPKSSRKIREPFCKYFLSTITDTNSTILDCGPGWGTYSKLISKNGQRIYPNMDCCEIFEPYVKKYNLKNLYNNVYVNDICDFEFDWYDAIIMGDIVEHIEITKAQELIQSIYNKCKHLIIIVPFLYEQGPSGGNKYEAHLQPDLTEEIFLERYTGFKLLIKVAYLGIFIKEKHYMEDSQ